jgi:LuxR family maltose regulon positive regulatory protein
MSGDLLRTKLYVPRLRPFLVPRPRLIEKLNTGYRMGCKLILISAPAGFGKSTLLIDWVQQVEARARVAWLSLDEGDNDIIRFLTYFVAALQTINGDIGQEAMVALHSPETMPIEGILTTLLNEISQFPEDIFLVLDDYHVIETPPIDQAISFLLDHLPAHMQLVIAGRIDPSLPLSRLRSRGQMVELRAKDLRFSGEETAVFLNRVVGLNLSSQDVSALKTRTEGWIAGLQLAALSMQGLEKVGDVSDFINRFTGSDRYIQDYLTDEVLQQRPQGTRDFLLQTSVLRRLSGPLCDAVRGGDGETAVSHNNSQSILENLESANLFIIPLDNERQWYRYHHLFGDLLTQRLHKTFPQLIPKLHQRAGAWYENAGDIDEAIYHAQAAGDMAHTADILEKHWQDIVHRGELTRLKQLLDALGPDYTRKSAPLSMATCWIYTFTKEFDAIPNHLKDIRAALAKIDKNNGQQPDRIAVIPSLVETIEAFLSLYRQQAAKAKAHAQQAISLIPDGLSPASRGLLHGAAEYTLAHAHRELGELEQACAVMLDGLERLKASKNYLGAANSFLEIVSIYQELGKTNEAISLCNEMLTYIEEHHWDVITPRGLVHVTLADLQADSHELERSRKNWEIGRRLGEQIKSEQILQIANRVAEKLDNTTPRPQPLVEPLSQRELEVLQLVAQGLSNREICEELYLALDTVKGHNRRIFGKLGVKNRAQAINKAIALKIIPPHSLS